MPSQRVVVIGAGIGGLVAALELASRGVNVTVIERGLRPGGKLREVTVDGQAIDAGPTVFTMRQVFEDIFTLAGSSLTQHLTLTPLQTLARHAWSDTERLDLFADPERSAEAIGVFSGAHEARRYRRFCQQARRVFEALEHPFLHSSRPSPASLTRRVARQRPGNLLRMRPFSRYWRSLGRQFRDPRLQQLFARYATYMGSSPFAAPATLMLIAHVEQSGVWTLAGGMYRLAEAFHDLASRLGVEFRLGTEARQILLQGGQVSGLELATGERLAADAVVFNGDCAALAAGLLGAAVSGAAPSLGSRQRSLSALTWACTARTEGFPLHRHSIFFSTDYQAEFRAIFRQGRLPAEPTVYVCAQDRGERSGPAPGTAERLLVLVNAPPTGDHQTFDSARIEQCRQRMLVQLQRCGLGLEMDDGSTAVTTPAGFERLFPGTGGALYGRATHGWLASFRRPGARTRLPGLYLAGGSTHPGAGLPMAALSGRQAAFAVLQDRELAR